LIKAQAMAQHLQMVAHQLLSLSCKYFFGLLVIKEKEIGSLNI
jgi:hypothetical protein